MHDCGHEPTAQVSWRLNGTPQRYERFLHRVVGEVVAAEHRARRGVRAHRGSRDFGGEMASGCGRRRNGTRSGRIGGRGVHAGTGTTEQRPSAGAPPTARGWSNRERTRCRLPERACVEWRRAAPMAAAAGLLRVRSDWRRHGSCNCTSERDGCRRRWWWCRRRGKLQLAGEARMCWRRQVCGGVGGRAAARCCLGMHVSA